MSNQLQITPTLFTNARTGRVDKGFIAFDNDDSLYFDDFESLPDDDLEFLAQVVIECTDERLTAMLDFVREHQRGIHIGPSFYEWNEIKDILNTD